jgi:transcriptional regulator with XRE-family HTH domain
VNYFKANLKFILKRFGITQAEIALRLNIGQSTISNWLKGLGSPTVDNLVKIHQIFNIPIDILILTDLKSGDIITDDHVKEFKQKATQPGNPTAKTTKNTSSNKELSILNEPDETAIWMITQLLKSMQLSIDKIGVQVNQIHKKIVK